MLAYSSSQWTSPCIGPFLLRVFKIWALQCACSMATLDTVLGGSSAFSEMGFGVEKSWNNSNWSDQGSGSWPSSGKGGGDFGGLRPKGVGGNAGCLVSLADKMEKMYGTFSAISQMPF